MISNSHLQLSAYLISQFIFRSIRPPEPESRFVGWEMPTQYADWLDLLRSSWSQLPQGVRHKLRDDSAAVFEPIARFALENMEAQCREGCQTILYGDHRYPECLRAIDDPPLALNILGDPSIFAKTPFTAIVGARRAVPYALQQSYEVAKYLARVGEVVVSGGAYGCDIASHHGVLSTCIEPAPAVVVFAGGLSNLYPKGNSVAFNDLRSAGAVFCSERLWLSNARSFDFPVRNRIIAGLSNPVLIMQAGLKSGAMCTANRAAAYGRDVLVLLHSNLGDAFDGNTRLMLDGAVGFDSAQALEQQEYVGYRSLSERESTAMC